MKKNAMFFFPLALLLLLIGCVQSSPKSDTIKIHDSSGYSVRSSDSATYDPSSAVPDLDPDGSIARLEELARKDPGAAYDLGLRFFRGDGIRQDSYQGLQWMRDAAERNNLEATKALGRLYLTGLEEMGADYREAEKWLTIASKNGDTEALQLLNEATTARQNEDDFYRWKKHWRPIFYRSWYHGYRYNYYWRGKRWYNY